MDKTTSSKVATLIKDSGYALGVEYIEDPELSKIPSESSLPLDNKQVPTKKPVNPTKLQFKKIVILLIQGARIMP